MMLLFHFINLLSTYLLEQKWWTVGGCKTVFLSESGVTGHIVYYDHSRCQTNVNLCRLVGGRRGPVGSCCNIGFVRTSARAY